MGVLEGLLQQVAARHRKTWRLQLAGAAASLTLLAGAVGGTSPAVIGAVGAVRGRRSSGPWVRSVAGGHRGRGCGPWPAVIGSVDSEATPPGPTMPAPSRTFSGHDPATGVTAQSGRARSRSPVARRAVSSVLLAKVNEHGPASVLT
ncbi:hypothetical protein ACFYM5_25190 [Streptomyces sp. NPDC006706]|uniref:hypothetical protein n=1 Tax=Streptomyces sp. NPDC006706 TaxID=3364761 RepID=UPI0036AABB19